MRPSTISSSAVAALLLVAAALASEYADQPAYQEPVDGLDDKYYIKSCPDMERIIQNAVTKAITDDYTIAAGLLRLHFHDCAVRGCDGSVLIDAPGSEKYANASRTLRGFKLIETIKKALEEKCPRMVSCADILTAAARDATHRVGGPYWQLKYGRKDGRVSRAEEAEYVPMGRGSVTDNIEFFLSRGLTVVDMVVLSGAHTIGHASCASIQHRLYNCPGTGKADETIDRRYAGFLRGKCQKASEYVELDGTTPTIFDRAYYQNLLRGMGVLDTDQKMVADSRAGPVVRALASQPTLFWNQFGASMLRLSRVGVLTGDEGEVRRTCYTVNSY